MNRLVGSLILFCIVGSLLGCSVAPTVTPAPTISSNTSCEGPAITFGDISDDPDEVIRSKAPFATYLAEHLADFGYKCGNIKVAKTVDEMITLIKQGEVDIYTDSMYSATLVSSATGAQPILRRWRNCDEAYYSVIFTTVETGITSIEDLSGHKIAMDQIYSTSGFVLPAAYLIDRGMNLAIKDAYDETVGGNEIGICFSYDDINTLNLVLAGKVSAGATDDYYFGKWEDEAPGRFVKLAETVSVPRQVVLVRSGLNIETRDAIKEVLLNAYLDPEGLAAMKQDVDTCRYDDTPEGIETTLEQMLQMNTKIMTIPGWQEAYLQGH